MRAVIRRTKATLVPLARRSFNSPVGWSLSLNFVRLGYGLFLLPLLLRLLPKVDLGMYYVFLSLNGIVAVLDLGFAPTIGRFVSYAMGGAKKLSAHGLADEPPHGEPNYPLLWELLVTARVFYGYVMLASFVLLGIFGSFVVWQKVGDTSSIPMTWAAWGVAVMAAATEIYFNVWNVFLRNLNQVLAATRISLIAYGVRLVLACLLLLCGAGLLALPVASLLSSLLIRNLSRAECMRLLPESQRPERVDWRAHFATIWPNSWRLGLYFGGAYLSTNANVILCSTVFGLQANADYGLSLQIINIASGMAAVWTAVKWPLMGQLIAQQKIDKLRQVLWPRLWLQVVTFIFMSAAAITIGPLFVHYISRDKEMLPTSWMILLAINGLLEGHCSVWNTLISMWNRLPMLWPSLATNIVGLGLNIVFTQLPHAQPGWLVLGPLLASAVLNYWFWPSHGARTLRLSWFQFLRYGLNQKNSAVGGS
jgi:O-antigen/teichoic acid export membrane protein